MCRFGFGFRSKKIEKRIERGRRREANRCRDDGEERFCDRLSGGIRFVFGNDGIVEGGKRGTDGTIKEIVFESNKLEELIADLLYVMRCI